MVDMTRTRIVRGQLNNGEMLVTSSYELFEMAGHLERRRENPTATPGDGI